MQELKAAMYRYLFMLMVAATLPLYANAQTNHDVGSALRNKYGHPSSESFVVTRNLELIVSYHGGEACELIIHARQAAPPSKNVGEASAADIDKVIDDVVPAKERGKELTVGFANVKCSAEDKCSGTVSEWEKVQIYHWFRNNQPDPERYATVQFQNSRCVDARD